MSDLFPEDEPKPKKKRTYIRDEIWDTCAVLFYPSGVPEATRTEVGKWVKALKELSATPAEIGKRAANWRTVFPDCVCTLRGLVRQWDRVAKPKLGAGVVQEQGRYDGSGTKKKSGKLRATDG